MVEFTINYVAIIVAAVVSMALGMLWYGPLFGKKWIKLSGITEKQVKEGQKKKGMAGMMPSMIGGLIANVIMAYVLSMLIDFAAATSAVDGAITGFWAWLGFVGTVTLSSVLWEGKSLEQYILNNGYNLVNLLVMGAIIASFA